MVGDWAALAAPVEHMLETLRHRGPDDSAVHLARGAALGHRRLSIIDLEGGHQPIRNEDGTSWSSSTVRSTTLARCAPNWWGAAIALVTGCDTEVIVHVYEERGPACVERFRGMFAFAIWDDAPAAVLWPRPAGREAAVLHAAWPVLAFASEIKALLTLLPGAPSPNIDALHQYLAIRIIAPPLTMFQGVSKLRPGHCLTFSRAEGVKFRSYWELDYEPKHQGGEKEILEALEYEMIEAVRLHLVSDVRVGAFLSGGLDSTLVVALAHAQRHAAPMPTFTLGLPLREHDEAPAARLVAQRYRTEHHEDLLVPSLTESLPTLVHHLDEPSDSLSVCAYMVAQTARGHVKVVLGGDGGDELFGGYDRYYGNLYANYYAALPRGLRRAIGALLIPLVPDCGWYKSKGHQLRWLHQASFLNGGERYARSLGYFYVRRELTGRLFGPALAELLANFDPYADIRHAYERARAVHPIDRMLHADSRIRLPDHPVMILDRTSMAHGLEARAPFMDHNLAEFAARLPIALKVRGRTLRYAQRKLCERYLPPELLTRRKQGFSSSLPYLLGQQYNQLQRALLADSWLARDGILTASGIQDLQTEHGSGRADHGNRLWLLINAEAWYRMKICGQTAAALSRTIAMGAMAGAGLPV